MEMLYFIKLLGLAVDTKDKFDFTKLTKLEQTILYIMSISRDLTKTRLHKSLYFIAKESIEANYKVFFEAKFIKNTHGPTLDNLDIILDNLKQKSLSTNHRSFAHDGLTKRWHFSSCLSAENEELLIREFSANEISIIDRFVNYVHTKTSEELSDLTHNEYYYKLKKGSEMSPYGEFKSYALDKEEIHELLES